MHGQTSNGGSFGKTRPGAWEVTLDPHAPGSLGSSAVPPPSRVWPYGIGGLGTGATPQISGAQGGSSGVGMRKSFPWVAADPPVMH
jgi:hypothetical protein